MFLVEGATDFAERLKVKHQVELTKQDKNFVIDISFRSQAHTRSQYLKLGIIGCRRNSLKKDTSAATARCPRAVWARATRSC